MYVLSLFITSVVFLASAIAFLCYLFRRVFIVKTRLPSDPLVLVSDDLKLPSPARGYLIDSLEAQIARFLPTGDANADMVFVDGLQRQLTAAIHDDNVISRPDLTDRSTRSFFDFVTTLYLSPKDRYMELIANNFRFGVVRKNWLSYHLWAALPFINNFCAGFLSIIRRFFQAPLLTRQIRVSLHLPTVTAAYISCQAFISSGWRSSHIYVPHMRVGPSERSYYFGREIISKIVDHLASRDCYSFTSSTLEPTARYIYYLWLNNNNKALPFMDILNEFSSSPCAFRHECRLALHTSFRDLGIRFYQSIFANISYDVAHDYVVDLFETLITYYLYSVFHFPEATVGFVGQDSSSL